MAKISLCKKCGKYLDVCKCEGAKPQLHPAGVMRPRHRRDDCLKWMDRHGYPEPPRSACVYCPYHSDREWNRLKTQEPKEFERAVRFEKDLQEIKAKTDNMRGVPFLHNSRIPLDKIEFSKDSGQPSLFGNECLGLCGI